VSYDDYDLNPLRLALNLASLGDGTLGFAQLVDREQLMLTDHGYQPDKSLETALKNLGTQLADILGQADEGRFFDELAALLEAQDCQPQLTRHDGVPHLHYARDDAPLDRWLSAMAVCGLVLYTCRHGRTRLRRCAATGCGRWLVDTSRNQSRRYCEHACASRTTVAAYRARQKRARTP
jgi:predicted RNA-binding Zn ribbon-like protein